MKRLLSTHEYDSDKLNDLYTCYATHFMSEGNIIIF